MGTGNIFWFAANLILSIILVFYIGVHGLDYPPPGWEYKDLLTVILTALTALLAGLAIFIGVLAIWGYNSIREAAERAAERVADAKAENTARTVAETVAARVAEQVATAQGTTTARIDDLTAALSEGMTDEQPRPPNEPD
jgi:hypothetical protein